MHGEERMRTRPTTRKEKHMAAVICLFFLLKPEVQAQVRACRSFCVWLCWLNLLLPIFCLAVFISLSFAFFPNPSLFLCVSLNILYPPLFPLHIYLLFFIHIFPRFSLPTSFSIRGQSSTVCWPYLWLKTSGCHLKPRWGGTQQPLGKMSRPCIHDKGCHSKLTRNLCQHWWINQQGPRRFMEIVKRENLFSHVISTCEIKCAFNRLPLHATVITSNGSWLLWQRELADSGQSADREGAGWIQMEIGDAYSSASSSESMSVSWSPVIIHKTY